MSLDQTHAEPVETTTPQAQRRRVSMLALGVLVAVVLAIAAGAFFLLSSGDDELMATTDQGAVAVAVANAQPAPPAFDAP